MVAAGAGVIIPSGTWRLSCTPGFGHVQVGVKPGEVAGCIVWEAQPGRPASYG